MIGNVPHEHKVMLLLTVLVLMKSLLFKEAEHRRVFTANSSAYLSRGSRASRKPSPNRLKPSTVMKMAKPGPSASHGVC
jgi:hypothetical protein